MICTMEMRLRCVVMTHLLGLRGPQGVEQRGWVVLHDALPAAREVGRHGGDLPDGGNDGGGVGGEALGLEERDA